MLEHYEVLSVKIIIKLAKSAGFPDFFQIEYEKADNNTVVYVL
jgi:hypothetical protein